LNVIIGEVLFIKLKTKLIFAVSLIGAILNIALNIILIYLFKNIIMAAITTFISYFVCFIILNRYIKSYSIINYDFSSLLRIVLAALIVVGVSVILLSFLPKTSVIIIGLSVFSIAVFIVLNLVFKVITKKQVFFLVNVWRIR
ncbi:MAG: hypothetical protein FJW63_09090, partial [Actinobacteria bacterium]|nr:hypothetical protein [Actinomycetota bacterium]